MQDTQTFVEWMKTNLGDSLEDIANHGVDGGFPGLTYYQETCALYERYEDEIWEMLYEDADSFGLAHPLALIATFDGVQNVNTGNQFKNLLVWYAAKRVAQAESNA